MDQHPSTTVGGIEFTYRWYRGFLRDIRSKGYEIKRFADSIGEGDVVLRHDVDLSLEAAVRLARLEADMGVRSTYCVLVTSPLYNTLQREDRSRVCEIESLGHEVALHFSTHEYWPPDETRDDEAIERRVEEEQTIVGTLVSEPPTTVSFHIPPEWVLDRPFDGFRSTYAPSFFSDMGYVADSGQRWRGEPPALPDPPETAQVLVHPGLWGEEDASFEERIDQHVLEACRHANRRAHREFVTGGTG